jgi:membrane protease YdiL (CAAX protease family)
MTPFDAALVAVLLLVVPGRALWSDLRRGRPAEPRAARYRRTIVLGAALAGWLLALWRFTGRPWASLGLDPPLTAPGLARLGGAALLVLLLAATTRLRRKPADPATRARAAEILPAERGELPGFLLAILVAAVAWELLYRGYLLWALEPWLGSAGAILAAAAAYAAGHGYKGRGPFLGAIAGALVFTLAFALTRSLWWLILLHAGLPLVGLLASRARAVETDARPGPPPG